MTWWLLTLHAPSLQLHRPLSLHKRGHSLSCTRERREHITRTPSHWCCAAICHPCPGSCVHRNRESRPPKPAPFVSSSVRVKTGNQVFGSDYTIDRSYNDLIFFLAFVAAAGDRHCNLYAMHRAGRLLQHALCRLEQPALRRVCYRSSPIFSD